MQNTNYDGAKLQSGVSLKVAEMQVLRILINAYLKLVSREVSNLTGEGVLCTPCYKYTHRARKIPTCLPNSQVVSTSVVQRNADIDTSLHALASKQARQ